MECWRATRSPEWLEYSEGGFGWEEVKWDGWTGHTGSCRPWWRLEEGIEGAVRTSDLDFREGILDWKGREGLRMKVGRAVRRGL